jgi:hypothetical protein
MNTLRLLLLVVAAFLSGCANRFEQRWTEASGWRSNELHAGRWAGEWRSRKHRNAAGELKCVLSRQAEGRYHASFKAKWLLFTSYYDTEFTTRQRGKVLEFSGQQDLGSMFGGVYTFNGSATPGTFVADYHSSYDSGTFKMQRVGGGPAH